MDPITMGILTSILGGGQGMGKAIGGLWGDTGSQWGEVADALLGGTKMSFGERPSLTPPALPMTQAPNIFAGLGGGGQDDMMRMLQRMLGGGR